MRQTDLSREAMRAQFLSLRRAQISSLAETRSALVQQRLVQSALWQKAASIALYMPIRGEVDTAQLAASALAQGKSLYLPRVCEHNQIRFMRCSDLSSLQPGFCGILEPVRGERPERLDLLVLPGVVFDKAGFRLGYGAGCYDRFLAKNSVGATVGLCFGFQIVPELPAKPWDMRVQYLCTEEGFL